MKLWTYALREIGRRRLRTALTVIGVGIGVAALVAVLMTAASSRAAYHDLFAAVAQKAELEVRAVGEGSLDPALQARISSIEGVQAAVPVVQTTSALLAGGTRSPVMVMGVDPARDGAAREYVLEAGAGLEELAPGQVLVPGPFARDLGLGVGGRMTLLTLAGPVEVEVAGLLAPRGAALGNAGAVVYLPLEEAQRAFKLGTEVNGLQLVLAEDVEPETVREGVVGVLPPGVEVRTPGSRGDVALHLLEQNEQGLNSLSAVALVAAAFIIMNAFLMSLTERRRELALLRALGTTRRQLVRLVLREAFLVGGLGTLLGLALGALFATGLTRSTEELLLIDLELVWTPQPFLAGLLLGLGASLLAVLFPARTVAARPPLEGLLADGGREEDRPEVRFPLLRGGLLVANLLLIGYWIFGGYLPAAIMAPLTGEVFLAMILALPLIIPVLSRVSGTLLRPFLHTEGRLASLQADRHLTRTSLTVSVLFVAMSAAIFFGVGSRNSIDNLEDYNQRTADADFFLRGVMPDLGTLNAPAVPEEVGREAAALPGITHVEPQNWLNVRAQGVETILVAREFSADRVLPIELVESDERRVREGLARGEVVLGLPLSQKTGLQTGGEITLDTARGARQVRIAGIADEYSGGGLAVVMERRRAAELFRLEGADVFLIHVEEGRLAQAERQLRDLAGRDGYLLQSHAEFVTYMDQMVEGILGFHWLLMALLFVTGGLGVANTLTMNVIEQRREVGLLRAVAMTRGQVRRMMLGQAAGIGVMSVIPSVPVGIFLVYLSHVGLREWQGQAGELRFYPGLVAGILAAGLVVAVVAGYLPARQAARVKVVDALQYE